MASPSVDKHVSDDNQLCDEPTTFPYLLTLDGDMKLLEDEPSEMMAPEEEPKESSPNPIVARMLLTTGKTTEILRANPTHNLTTTTSTTASSTATTPAATTTNRETAYTTKETLSTILTQLADAQEEITSLRHHAEQSDMRIIEYEQRLIIMENTLRQLMHLCPTIQNTVHMVCDSIAQMTQHSNPTEEETGAKVLDYKRKPEENSNDNPFQQQTKRPKTVKTYAAGSEEKKYKGNRPFCSQCNSHHEGLCGTPCNRCKCYGHQTKDCRMKICFGCGNAGHFRNKCPQQKNRNNNNKKKKTYDGVIVSNVGEAGQDSNMIMGTFLHHDLDYFSLNRKWMGSAHYSTSLPPT